MSTHQLQPPVAKSPSKADGTSAADDTHTADSVSAADGSGDQFMQKKLPAYISLRIVHPVQGTIVIDDEDDDGEVQIIDGMGL